MMTINSLTFSYHAGVERADRVAFIEERIGWGQSLLAAPRLSGQREIKKIFSKKMLDKYLKVWYTLITVREEPAGDKGGNDND